MQKQNNSCCLLIHYSKCPPGQAQHPSVKLSQGSHGHQRLSKSLLLLNRGMPSGLVTVSQKNSLLLTGLCLLAVAFSKGILSGHCRQQKA